MPLPSYRVLSPVWIGPPPYVKVTPKKIASEEHNSYKFIPNTETSWSYNLSLPSKPHFIRRVHGETLALRKTSNNKFIADDYPKNGDFTPQIDDFNRDNPDSFEKWKYAAQQRPPNSFSYVKLPEETANSGVMVSLGSRRAEFPHLGDTPIPKYISDLVFTGRRNNEIGPALSRIEANVRQKLNGYLRTRNGRELASYLTSLGLSPEDIGYIADGFLPDSAIYGVNRAEDGRVFLTAAKDAYSKIVRDAKFLGVETEGLLNSILAEEIVHIWRRDFDKDGNLIDIEMSAKDIVAKHYTRLSKGADGDPKRSELRRRYQKLAAIKEFDKLTTPKRYGKKSFYQELNSKNRIALKVILASEAVDNGYRGEAIAKYVAHRLGEIDREAEGRSEKPQAKSRLEKIVEKEADSKEAPKETGEPAEASSE